MLFHGGDYLLMHVTPQAHTPYVSVETSVPWAVKQVLSKASPEALNPIAWLNPKEEEHE